MPRANEVLARVRDSLQDVEERRWPDHELYRYIDDGQRLMVQLKPEINSGFITHTLQRGARQTLPNTLTAMINIQHKTEADKAWLDRYDPAWQSGAESASIDQYMRVEDKRTFYVYPPSEGGEQIDIFGGITPTKVLLTSDELVVEQDQVYALADFVCFRALMKDSDNAENKALAESYQASFYASLGLAVQTENAR